MYVCRVTRSRDTYFLITTCSLEKHFRENNCAKYSQGKFFIDFYDLYILTFASSRDILGWCLKSSAKRCIATPSKTSRFVFSPCPSRGASKPPDTAFNDESPATVPNAAPASFFSSFLMDSAILFIRIPPRHPSIAVAIELNRKNQHLILSRGAAARKNLNSATN